MKPLYVLLILFAVFITGFADALEAAFTAIVPGIGFIVGMSLAMCINVTMGAGLVLLLVNNGMFHPKFGPAGIVAGFIPGIDSLPIWVGLVIAGILQKMAEEETGLAGSIARVVSSAQQLSFSNPMSALQSAKTISQAGVPSAGRVAPVQNQTAPTPRASVELKSPTPTIANDIAPRIGANDNRTSYVQKTA